MRMFKNENKEKQFLKEALNSTCPSQFRGHKS